MSGVADELFEFQAAVLRTLASPRRLEILHRLGAGPAKVHELGEELGITQPNVSAHLAALRAVGFVEKIRDGREIRYRVTDPDIVPACEMLRGVLARRLVRLGALVTGIRADEVDGAHLPEPGNVTAPPQLAVAGL